MMESQRFAGKVAVVTGGGSGIGQQVAIDLAASGARVIISGRTKAKLDCVVNIIIENGGQALAVVGDAGSDADNRKLFEEAVCKFGRLDHVFANAGSGKGALFQDITEELVEQILNANIKSVVYALKYGLPAIAKSGGGGSIVVNSSTAGHSVMFGSERMKDWGLYAASKAAADMLVQYAAIEAAVHGSRVNAVGPGLVRTDIIPMSKEQWDDIGRECHLLQKIGTVTEVSKLVLFLLSEDASFSTGSTHLCSGGMHIKI